jgi:hypothetical protein
MMSENMKKWPDDGELDIMEHVGFNQGYIHASVHTKSITTSSEHRKQIL